MNLLSPASGLTIHQYTELQHIVQWAIRYLEWVKLWCVGLEYIGFMSSFIVFDCWNKFSGEQQPLVSISAVGSSERIGANESETDLRVMVGLRVMVAVAVRELPLLQKQILQTVSHSSEL